jgi:hypothetical protein
MTMNDAARVYLEKKQAEYGRWHQEVAATVKFMEEHNHPYARQFRLYRQRFDRLPYASGPGTRFFSFKDESNYSELLPPYLAVSCNPRPFNGYSFDLNSGNFLQYLHAAAQAYWPEETAPTFNLGKWRIATTDIQMADALIFVYADNDHHVQNSTIYIQFDDVTEDSYEQVEQIIRFYHADYLLAPEPPALENMPGLSDEELNQLAGLRDAWL